MKLFKERPLILHNCIFPPRNHTRTARPRADTNGVPAACLKVQTNRSSPRGQWTDRDTENSWYRIMCVEGLDSKGRDIISCLVLVVATSVVARQSPQASWSPRGLQAEAELESPSWRGEGKLRTSWAFAPTLSLVGEESASFQEGTGALTCQKSSALVASRAACPALLSVLHRRGFLCTIQPLILSFLPCQQVFIRHFSMGGGQVGGGGQEKQRGRDCTLERKFKCPSVQNHSRPLHITV